MRIAVTGGSGFIGQAVIKRAKDLGYDAWPVDISTGVDVQNPVALNQALEGADSVIHLAGMLGTSELFAQPHLAVDVNIKGALNVLQICAWGGIGYVGITMPDSHWANVYQATKLAACRLATAWHRQHGVAVSHVRAFNVYGPGQKHGTGHPQKFLPTFATKAWRGEPLPVFGNGLQTIDAIYVDDVARMLVDATGFGDDETFDAGTGHDVTVRYFARMVNRLCGQREDNIEFLPMRPGESEESSIRARGDGWEVLGWQPPGLWDRYDELRATIDWYKP